MSRKATTLTTQLETLPSGYAELDNDYPLWKAATEHIRENIKSQHNGYRAAKDVWDLGHWASFKKPTTAMILEYVYSLIKIQARRPEHVYRILRYLYETSPILDELPRVSCAYLRTPFLLTTKQIVHYLTAVQDNDLRTALALAASGFLKFGTFNNLVVGDFDVERGSFINGGFIAPDWVRLYLTEHYKRCKAENRVDTDPFFYNYETLKPFTTYELTSAMRHYDRRTGLTMYRHCYLVPFFPAVPENAIVRYF